MRSALACAVLVASACTAGPSAAPTGARAPAAFVLANISGLLALDSDCRSVGRVAELPPQSAATTPSLHPDRTKLAFALTPGTLGPTGFGSDLYEVGLDGTGLRVLVAHEAENVFYASPRYDPKGGALYAHRRAAVVEGSRYIGNTDEIVRIDLGTGARRVIVRDGADPTISPDGSRLVYVRLKDALPDGLWSVALPDGSDARPFLRTSDTFFYLQTPRFSPSGAELIFSAAGRQSAAAGGRLAHLGIPSELYLAPADGSRLDTLGTTGDDAIPTWSPDGTKIAYVGLGTFVILTVADKTTRVCAQGEEFFFADPVWVR